MQHRCDFAPFIASCAGNLGPHAKKVLQHLAQSFAEKWSQHIASLPTTSTVELAFPSVELAFPLSAPPATASVDLVLQPHLLVQLVTLLTRQKELTHYCNMSFPTTEPTFA